MENPAKTIQVSGQSRRLEPAAAARPVGYSRVVKTLEEIYARWWPESSDGEVLKWEARRHAFHIGLILSESARRQESPGPLRVCDIGGGWGAFACGCASLGMRATIVDDFRDPGAQHTDDPRHRMPAYFNVSVVRQDLLQEPLPFEATAFDAVTSFDVLEHLHHSPKRLLRSMVDSLRPGGLLVLSVPNCMNLRKRLAFPLGVGQWSPLEEWYEQPLFRGHVREPNLKDLAYIAKDLKLVDIRYLGRNWLGRVSPRAAERRLTAALDRLLTISPSLCSNLYLVGHKPWS